LPSPSSADVPTPFTYSPINGEQNPPQILRRLTEAQMTRFSGQKQRINETVKNNTILQWKNLGLKFSKSKKN